MPKRNEKNGRVTLSPLLQHSKISNAEVDRLIGLVKGKIGHFFHFLLMHNEIPAPDLLALLNLTDDMSLSTGLLV